MDINQTEEKILKFWKDSKTFEQSVEKPAGKKPKKSYVFYDGPPFITGLPHYGTILPSVVKDCVPRFWTMKGFKVERVWGWDCHGLPAENKVENKLGLKNKKDIEGIGVCKFVGECKNYVNDVSSQWQWYIDKIARWIDMKNAYRTMDLKFMESVIWAFKELYEKDLIYEGYRSSLHCPRCATPLSKFEVTMDAGSYKDVTEMSVIVKFKLKASDSIILAWTTTPWTLPGNLALAIGKNIDYVEVEKEKKKYILAKEKVEEIFKKDYKIINEFKGKELLGKEYEPLFKLDSKEISKNKKVFKIYAGDFVTTENGTGVVHVAPNFGEDDFELGKKNNFPNLDLMDENGIYSDLAGEFKGMYFKDAGKEVMKKLGEKLFSKFNYTHSYPFCYRCSAPLIYKTQKAWYLDTDKIRDKMLKTNKKINWVPEHFRDGRFNYNLENAPHWCLSRTRYWGSPIPVWKCESCGEIKVVGSIKEIEKLSGKKVDDLHKPEIDEHEFKCKCSEVMKRIPEILDCWFESGAMPFAQWHYPFERKNDFKNIFPADFIVEYTGQLRGWFYYLHVLSNSLFDSEAFRNVMVTGVLAGTDGRKMSKSYGNYPDPKETLEKYGGDAMRIYFLSSPVIVGGDMNLSERDLKDTMRKNVMLLQNVYNFYEEVKTYLKDVESDNIMDKWILSQLNVLVSEVTDNMEKYEVPLAARPITSFIDDLSTWYLRLNRDRLNAKDEKALATLKKVLETLSKIIAPFMPYLAENIWQGLSGNDFKNKNKSVHLQEWPNIDKKKINRELGKKMAKVREIVSLGLKERDINKIGLRWPLKSADITTSEFEIEDWMKEVISNELNVKEVYSDKIDSKTATDIKLDFEITPELEAEGYARELSRLVQSFRKKLGLVKDDKIKLKVLTDDLKEVFESQKDFIAERVNANEFEVLNVTTDKERFKNTLDFKVKDKRGVIVIEVVE